MAEREVIVGAAVRPFPGETVNGDAWSVERDGGGCTVAAIDGLGHGPKAAQASALAVAALKSAPRVDPTEAVHRCHEALRGTRGAALLVARIDAGTGRLVVVGVGNVEARLRRGSRWERIVTDRGIAGVVVPRLHPVAFDLGADWLLLIHTDGVSSRFDPDEIGPDADDPDRLAEAVLARWGRQTDDATVVVARPAPSAADRRDA